MKLIAIAICLSVCAGTSNGRLSKAEMRQALSVDPLSSHQRDRAVPLGQNMNVELPVSDRAVQPLRKPSASVRPTMLGHTSGAGIPVSQNRRMRPIAAGKPVRQQEMVLGQIKPTKISQPQPAQVPSRPVARVQQRSVVTDKILSKNVRPSDSVASTNQQTAGSQQECSLHIPSFLLPGPSQSNMGSSLKCPSFLLPGRDINRDLINLMVEHWTGMPKVANTNLSKVRKQITQVEFEQKCLIPALRAYVLGGPACKTREIQIYMEWVLYLRERLFNI